MKKTKMAVALCAAFLSVTGFVAKVYADKHRVISDQAYFKTTNNGFATVFSGATTSNLNTSSSSGIAAYIVTGTNQHRLYASKSVNKPLFWK